MKRKFTKVIALVLSVALMLSVTAFAAQDDPVFEKKGGGVAGETINVTFNGDFTQLNVEYTSSAIHEADGVHTGFYMVWMVTGTTVDEKTYYTPTTGTIQYIGQGSASGTTFSFSGVYPTDMTDAAIMISGAGLYDVDTADGVQDGLYTLGYVKMPYTLGDVNDDGKINGLDALLILKYSAEMIDLTDTQKLAADVNVDGKYNGLDALEILKYSAEMPSVLG